MSKPGQGKPDTQSYDRPMPAVGGTDALPAAPPANRSTAVMPEGLLEESAALSAPSIRRTDPAAVGPAPQAPLALSPPAPRAGEPVVDKAPGAFRAGDLVDHFEIVGLVGQGGMGSVYKAFDRDLGRTVAIKTLHGIYQHTPQSLARFRREAQAASRVVHPNLVIIYSSGTFDETPYIAMEYLSGRSLSGEIAEGPMPVARTADILGAACAGVYAAHRADVVHRDLKPANIFLARTPMGETPKILDFGISRIGDDNSSLTGTGDVVGTTYYLAPEQAAGRDLDARADQYALGVILYECLTGVRPFVGDSVYAIMRNIVEGIFQPPAQLRPEIPRELEAVVLRAMSRVPENRFPRVRDLGLALVPFMSAKGNQQWGHHFIAPEAEMPVVPSLAIPAPAGRPAGSALPDNQPPAPTKILPQIRKDNGEKTTHTSPPVGGVPDITLDTTNTRPRVRRGGILVLAASAVALLTLVALWALWPPKARETARRASPVLPTAIPGLPKPEAAAPVPQPSLTREVYPPPVDQPTEPAELRSRDLRKKGVTKLAKPREDEETTENPDDSPKGPTEQDPKGPKTGMW